MANTKKQAQIEKWKEKGIEWCANALWEARNRCIDHHRYSASKHREEAGEWEEWKTLNRRNSELANALLENGIRPEKLRITYKFSWCECAECWNDEVDCDECDSQQTEIVTKSMSLYSYTITDGFMDGLLADFNTLENLELLKVVNAKTGEIIGEWDANG